MLSRVAARVSPLTRVNVRRLSTSSHELQIFEFEELAEKPSASTVERMRKAFGYDGLGVLAVRGVPEYQSQREALLPLARKLAHLPEETLLGMEDPESLYNFGWSRGKEKLEGGAFDFSKGSFYANPLHDRPVDDEDMIKQFPSFYRHNIWPTEHMPELEPLFKSLGRLIVSVGCEVAKHFDHMILEENPKYTPNRIADILKTSRMCKGRLLHYYALEDGDDRAGTDSSWCGWHNDHGSLTGLCSAMFHDADGTPIPCPDEEAGLYVTSRHKEVLRVTIPGDCLAYQIGESSQVLSGGVLQATPHAVRGSTVPGVSRSTLAVFMEPEHTYPMTLPPGGDHNRVVHGARGELLPPSVPPLATRWNESQDFNEFTETTLSAYH